MRMGRGAKGYNFQQCIPSLHSIDELLERVKLRPLPPNPQTGHVCHVPGLGGTRCTAVHHSGLGQITLQAKDGQTCLAAFLLPDAGWNEVLGFVTLVKHELKSSIEAQETNQETYIRHRLAPTCMPAPERSVHSGIPPTISLCIP